MEGGAKMRLAVTSDWHLRPGEIFPKPFFVGGRELYDGHYSHQQE